MKTGRTGAAAKMGHNLVIEVTSWEATIVSGSDTSVTLDADGSSLKVVEGAGGAKTLSDKDKTTIEKSIVKDVALASINFRSTSVSASDDGNTLSVSGDLTLAGTTGPVSFTIAVNGEGKLTGTATVTQSGWKIKPVTAIFGKLKVIDEVEVEIDATVPTS